MASGKGEEQAQGTPAGLIGGPEATCTLAVEGAVATITISPPRSLGSSAGDLHWELGELFESLRSETSVRVIVLTGKGNEFYVPREPEFYSSETALSYRSDPESSWKMFTGILRVHQTMAEIEKPIIVRVNGDAIGFGSSLAFAGDLIVAVATANFVDIHLGMGEHPVGPKFGVVPGDGGAALVPLFMTPVKAKEYLMLAKPYTGAELAKDGIINYAVDAENLDSLVDDLVERLLRRSPFALAWTKRTINRRIVDVMNMVLDASVAYEMVTFLQLDRLKRDAQPLA